MTNAISGQAVTTLTNGGGAWDVDAFAFGNGAFSFSSESNRLTVSDVISGGSGTDKGSISLLFRSLTGLATTRRSVFWQDDTVNSNRFLSLAVTKSNTNISGNRTVIQPGDPAVTSPVDSDTDDKALMLQLNVPIFSSGATQSRVRQAEYRYRAANERYIRTARETERAARDAYLGVLSEISRVKALKQALASSTTALQATEAGYEVGTRTAPWLR